MALNTADYLNANVGVFKYFALLAIIFYAPNVALLFTTGYQSLAFLYVVLALLIIALTIYVQKTHNTMLAIHAFIFIAMVTLLPWQVTGGIGNSGVMWLFAFIVFALLLGDIKSGSIWIGVTYFISFLIFALQIFGVLPLPYSVVFMVNFYFASAITYAIIVVFARVRKNLEKQLSEQTQILQEAQKAAKIGNWEWDLKKDRIYWSDLLKDMFGSHEVAEDMDYKKYISLIFPEDRDRVGKTIEDALETGLPFNFEHRVKKANGDIVWIHGEGAIDFENQKMRGTAQDITARKKTELALIAQNDELKRAEKLMVGREQKMIELKQQIKQLEQTKGAV